MLKVRYECMESQGSCPMLPFCRVHQYTWSCLDETKLLRGNSSLRLLCQTLVLWAFKVNCEFKITIHLQEKCIRYSDEESHSTLSWLSRWYGRPQPIEKHGYCAHSVPVYSQESLWGTGEQSQLQRHYSLKPLSMLWKALFKNIFTLTSKPVLMTALHYTVMASDQRFLDEFWWTFVTLTPSACSPSVLNESNVQMSWKPKSPATPCYRPSLLAHIFMSPFCTNHKRNQWKGRK